MTTTTTMPRRIRLLIILALTSSSSNAFHANAPQTGGKAAAIVPSANEADHCCNNRRRSILQDATTSCWKITTCAIMSITATTNPALADANVIRSPGKCANGIGEGCDSLADNNELIRSLQKKSAANRESNQRVCRCNFLILYTLFSIRLLVRLGCI